jgi:hypothetical protein
MASSAPEPGLAFFAVVSQLFVRRVVQETRGRELESMDTAYATT